MGGGGGGGNSAADREEKRRLEEEARAKAAADRINSLFGIGGDASMSYAPNTADYQQTVWTDGTRVPQSQSGMVALRSSALPQAAQSTDSVVRDGTTYYTYNPNQEAPPSIQAMPGAAGKLLALNGNNMVTSANKSSPYYQTSILNEDAYNNAMQAYQRGAALRSRNQLYDTVGNDTFNYHAQRLNDSRDQAERSLRFQLARQGQFGGSLDVDQNSELAKGYNNGLMDARNLSDAARNDAMARDDQTRIDLINRVNAGMDEGSALASASSQMQSNINQARDQALSQSLGDAFGNVALLKKQWDYQQGMNEIRNQYPNYFTQGGNNGTVRS